MIETKFANQYLLERGINLESALGLGVEVSANGNFPRGIYRVRLNFDVWCNGKLLPDMIEEGIWFPHFDGEGSIKGYSFRSFPELIGKDGETTKFLRPKNGTGYPYILPDVWQVAAKPNHPLVLTEGPVKTLALSQIGQLAIGLNGVWGAVRNDEKTGTDLIPVLCDEFQWRGRKMYLAFDMDSGTNPSVRQALIRTLIVFHGYGAEAKVIRWPLAEGN
jgi:hypothetical protein